jgi:hypothetical protein
LKSKEKPQFMVIYQCLKCGFDFGITEQDKPKCFYCDSTEGYIEIERKKLTPEVLAERMKLVTDRMMENLQKAYKVRPKKANRKSDKDSEKELLEVMQKAKDLKQGIDSLKLKKRTKKNKS